MFAHAVYVGDREWNLKEAVDILVTVSEELNIIIPANEVSPAVYIDVPLDAVSEVSFENELVLDSQQPMYGVVLRLDGGGTTNCMLNATGYPETRVGLSFSSQKDANTLKRLVLPTNFRTNGVAPHGRSGTPDASEWVLSDEQLAAPAPASRDNPMPLGIAPLDHTIGFHSNTVSTIDPSMLEQAHTPQRGLAEYHGNPSNLVAEYDEDCLVAGHTVEMAVKGIDVSQIDVPQMDVIVEQAVEGIDVSYMGGLSHGDVIHRSIKRDNVGNASINTQVLDSRQQKSIGRADRPPDIRLLSSLPVNAGLNASEDAQRPQQAVSSVEQVENRRGPESQIGEHDALYYASPKLEKGHGRSPRILPRNSTPRTQKWPLKSNIPRAIAIKGPPIKLSRQLRNADGVVELLTEQTDNKLSTMNKDDAVEVNTSAKYKKSTASAPENARKGVKQSTERGKKSTQRKGKAVANEEPWGSLSGEYDISPPPKRVGSVIRPSGDRKEAANTRLNAKKATCDSKKKEKPVSTKASNAATSKDVTPRLRDGSNNEARASESLQHSVPDRPNGKNIDDDDDAIWDFDQAHEERQTLLQSRESVSAAKKQDVRIPTSVTHGTRRQLHSHTKKIDRLPIAHNQESVRRPIGAKPALYTLSRNRPRRTAAIKANRKIQGLVESDEIVDEEESVLAHTHRKRDTTLTAAKMGKSTNVGNGEDDRPRPSGKLPANELSTRNFIPDSISPVSWDTQRPDTTPDRKADSSIDGVSLAKDAPAEALQTAADGKRNDLRKGDLISAAETSVLLHAGHNELSNQPDPISAELGAESSEALVTLVPISVAQLRHPVTETEPSHIISQPDKDAKQGYDDLDTMSAVDEDQPQDVLPCTDNQALEPKSTTNRSEEEIACSRAPTAPMTVRARQRRIPPGLAGSVEESLLKPTSTRRNLFVSKLNASMPQVKDTNPQVKASKASGDAILESKESNVSKSAEPERSSLRFKVTALEKPGVVSLGEASHVQSPREALKSTMQKDGEGKGLLTQSSKRAGGKSSTLTPATKRKVEQAQDINNKRVKVMPKERLERVSARRPGSDAKKTPLPSVSNKPVVIGFSASGPRNQGTISTKKSRTPEDVRTGAPDAVKSREHQVPETVIYQAQADFTLNQEALEPNSENIQSRVNVPGIAQNKDRGSTMQKLVGHHENVNTVATTEAQRQEKGAEKRKCAPFADDPAPWEHEQLSKRRKREIRTPPPAQKHHHRMLPDMGLALVRDRSQRVSSQNTRVNENGSPMPFFVNRNEVALAVDQSSDDDDGKDALAEARLEEQSVLQHVDPVISEPVLPLRPLVSTTSTLKPKARVYQSLSSNNKQVPSSPHASSAFGTMPPHHLYDDGGIVNAETKEPIVPAKPQDPFLDSFLRATQKPPNAFMDALCRSTEFVAQSLVAGANDKKDSGGVVMRQNPHVDDDPDKTLVEPGLRERHEQVHISDNSSNSQSCSSTQASQPDESSGHDSEAEKEVKWRKGLEPHQEDMLDCLLTVSHVSNDSTIV